jgi:hypothetical protein
MTARTDWTERAHPDVEPTPHGIEFPALTAKTALDKAAEITATTPDRRDWDTIPQTKSNNHTAPNRGRTNTTQGGQNSIGKKGSKLNRR